MSCHNILLRQEVEHISTDFIIALWISLPFNLYQSVFKTLQDSTTLDHVSKANEVALV